jgi:hypothetical protein
VILLRLLARALPAAAILVAGVLLGAVALLVVLAALGVVQVDIRLR